jgi:ribosomal protein S18 acetylase RimI-like enzyme
MLEIRATTEKDAHYLLDIDIKCFEYAWLPDDWRKAGKNCLACVATWNGTPIAVVIFSNNQCGGIDIAKIAVKAAYRNQGIARRLLYNCALYARETGAVELLMLVPESRLRPGEPDDISRWLMRLGFRAEVPLFKDWFEFYGEREDGVLFYLPIPQQSIDTGICIVQDQT